MRQIALDVGAAWSGGLVHTYRAMEYALGFLHNHTLHRIPAVESSTTAGAGADAELVNSTGTDELLCEQSRPVLEGFLI